MPTTIYRADLSEVDTIEGHENGAIEGDRRGVNQAGDLLRTPDDREMDFLLWVRNFVTGPGALQDLAKEKTQGTDDLIDRVVGEFPVPERWAVYSRSCSGPSWSGERWK